MAQARLREGTFSRDISEFLYLLGKHDVRYLIVGGEAVIYYGYARLTGDIDVFYERREPNARKLFAALEEFWNGKVPGLEKQEELLEEGVIIQFGRPPHRIDLINHIDGVDFSEAWPGRTEVILETQRGIVTIFYIGIGDLIRNKEALKRPKDLDDLRFLRACGGQATGDRP